MFTLTITVSTAPSSQELQKATEDLAFLMELQRQRLLTGMPESERFALRMRLVNQFISGIKPLKSSCVVCAGENPLTWDDARVDITRQQAHCPTHKEDFHNAKEVHGKKGCVSCEPYDPFLYPLDRYQLQTNVNHMSKACKA
jgi:hypothetical protein